MTGSADASLARASLWRDGPPARQALELRDASLLRARARP